MFIQQIYTGCLAQAAYYIESEGEAAIVDPLRDIQVYLDIATARKAQIKFIFETHFHADFVSGHIDLVRKTGAKVVYGPKAKAGYDIISAPDGEVFRLGKINIELIHTPGHTIESACFLIRDENNKSASLFSGDTLFVGDVGRVDLAARQDLPKEELASMLYDSIEKLKQLPDEVIVYPGHGAGSACGKNIGTQSTTTIGEQRRNNYALQPMKRDVFVKMMTEGLETPPQYFFIDAAINRNGYENNMETLMGKNLHPLNVEEFKKTIKADTAILDTRSADDFAKEHIPGAINVGLGGQFAIWVGSLFKNIPFLLVCDEGKENETVMRLARVGYDNVLGYLKGGLKAWKDAGNKTQGIESISAADFVKHVGDSSKLIDVRRETECANGAIKDSINVPLISLPERMAELNKKEHYYIYCQGGYRSMIACSLLQKNGFTHITNVLGGMGAIAKTGIKLEVIAEV
ncbi:MAG: MBL fold metallo-hydrolase [Bacteroidia bacterium]